MTSIEIRHFHLFAGLGGGAKGFNRAQPRVGKLRARFRCLGGIDVDPAAMRDFERLTGAPGTVLDLFDREQYRAEDGVTVVFKE
jgi:site-specific DNA-cytosine methylase